MAEGKTYIQGAGRIADLPKGEVKNLRHVFKYLKNYVKESAIVLVALIVASSSVLGIGTGLKYLIDEGFSKQDEKFLDLSLLVLLLVIAVLAASSYTRFYFITKIGEGVVADIRRDVYKKLLTLSPGFFEITRTGEVLSRLTTDTSVIQLVVGSSLAVAIRNVIMLIGGVVMLVATSTKLTAFIAILIPIVVLQIITLGKKVRKLSRNSQDKIADLSSHGQETLSSIRIVQSFGQESGEFNKFSGFVGEAYQAAMERVKMRAKLTAIVIVLVFGSVGLVLWIGGKDVLNGYITGGELSSFVFYSILVAASTGAISEVVGDIQRAAGAAERLMELLNAKSDIEIPSMPVQLDNNFRPEVTFNNVTFYYPTRKEIPALHNISFKVNPGEKVALVGPSGSGKSTILQLLLRFYDPQEGSIRVGDVNLRDTDPNELRKYFAFVPQEPIVFSDTAYENIKYGKQDATEAEIIEAAEIAQAHDFISKLPKGYQTFLGEKGVMLSGGERQRIALARAILRDPKILLLDEATSSLDAENEQLVQQALEKIMENRTTIVIAHRLATILKSDKIIVISNGQIEAMGTHQELVKQGSLYARLAELQFGS